MKPDLDSLRTPLIRALSYLNEKYPGIAVFLPGESDETLCIHLAGGERTRSHFLTNVREMLPQDFGFWESIEGEDVTFAIIHPDTKVLESSAEYLRILAQRYPDKHISVEDHLPVIAELVRREQKWRVCQSPLSQKFYGSDPSLPRRGQLPDIGITFGWGNGYVGVCEEHPWYRKHYDTVDYEVLVHGGLTYDGKSFPDPKNDKEDGLWWLGFDTGHYSDDIKSWPKERVEQEAKYLFLQAAWAFAGIDNPMHEH